MGNAVAGLRPEAGKGYGVQPPVEGSGFDPQCLPADESSVQTPPSVTGCFV